VGGNDPIGATGTGIATGTRAVVTAVAPPTRPAAAVGARRRNARGQGSRLADDIVAGARAIIERTGSTDAVTLRSVAREVGIAAPSIYAHFADRDAILWALVAQVFEDLRDRLRAATEPIDDPVERLLAGCNAYVTFGLEEPALYRLLFAKEFPPLKDMEPVTNVVEGPSGPMTGTFPSVGGEAFALMVDAIDRCVAAGESGSTNSFDAAAAVWVALHGMVSLWLTMCEFPWPDRDAFVRRLVLPLAGITR